MKIPKEALNQMFKVPNGDNTIDFTKEIEKAWNNNNKYIENHNLNKEIENKIECVVRDLLGKLKL